MWDNDVFKISCTHRVFLCNRYKDKDVHFFKGLTNKIS